MTLLLLAALLYPLTIVWLTSDFIMWACRRHGTRATKRVRLIHAVLGPLFLPASAGIELSLVISSHGFDVVTYIYPASCVVAWVFRQKDDDDWWKKLRNRAAGAVKNLGHRLIVVPAGA